MLNIMATHKKTPFEAYCVTLIHGSLPPKNTQLTRCSESSLSHHSAWVALNCPTTSEMAQRTPMEELTACPPVEHHKDLSHRYGICHPV